MKRVYLDYNATTPLAEASRHAIIEAMDLVGNPSSVYKEGRAAKALIEKARAQISEAFGASNADIVFTSSASEAAALSHAGRALMCSDVEHEAVSSWCRERLDINQNGEVSCPDPEKSSIQLANSETGILQDLPHGLAVSDCTQAFGKLPIAFNWLGCDMALISAHKLGGPKGVGALVLKQGLDVEAQIKGGGQEMGRRSGTENILGIAGFGAAAKASAKALEAGIWENVARLRDALEQRLVSEVGDLISVGRHAKRLPNTLNIITPGWKGETQVMQMDLAGFSVSAGSACSSGKVKSSKVLEAMGYDHNHATSAMRVSLGPHNTKEEIERFGDAWLSAYKRWAARSS